MSEELRARLNDVLPGVRRDLEALVRRTYTADIFRNTTTGRAHKNTPLKTLEPVLHLLELEDHILVPRDEEGASVRRGEDRALPEIHAGRLPGDLVATGRSAHERRLVIARRDEELHARTAARRRRRRIAPASGDEPGEGKSEKGAHARLLP